MRIRTLFALVVLVVPTWSLAQTKPADTKNKTGDQKPAPAGAPTPTPAGAPAPAGTAGADEAPGPEDFKVNDAPNAPDATTTHMDDVPVEVKAAAWKRPTKDTYPIEAIERPLTLTEG